MTYARIAKTISQIPRKNLQVIRVKCRPPEKSNEVLVCTVSGKRWYCERPKYFWSKFDQIFVKAPYLAEPKLVYPDIKEPLVLFDDHGRFWQRQEMSSFGLVKHFLAFPQLYLTMLAKHTREAKYITSILKKIRPGLADPKHFIPNLRIFIDLYARMYWAQCTIFMTFDELVYQFRQSLLKHLPKETVNLYFPQFLAANATKLALSRNFISERGSLEYSTTRGVLYAMNLRPRAFYALPHYFPDFADDPQIINTLIEHKISDNDLQKIFAFRMIVPLGFQINEETLYMETAGLSAHLGILMKAMAKKLNLPVNGFQSMGLAHILNLLNKMI